LENIYRNEWLDNVGKDLLSGLVVGIALIPEAIAFSLLIGISPMYGLYASFCIAIVTSIFGGRSGMISAATGSMALVLVGLVRDYGVEYMLAATLLAGLIQIVLGSLKVGNLLKFIPKPVMLGFVNSLAILIFKSQLDYLFNGDITMYILTAVGIVIIYTFPKINKTIPAPLVAILLITFFTLITHTETLVIGDLGTIEGHLPLFHLANVPLTIETLEIILPTSISLAIVGLVESLLTAKLLDEKTDTGSNKNIESIGQGLANVVSSLFGGMAGCAMIGQSMINYKSGGRGRLSSLSAAIYLMILIVILNNYMVKIPIAALVAVMIVVAISTFEWITLKTITTMPRHDAIVMVATMAIVLITDNLAFGVVLGIVLSALFFANHISQTLVTKTILEDRVIYKCEGQLFFASTTHFVEHFDFNYECPQKIVELDLTHLEFWDDSAGDAFDTVISKFHNNGKKVIIKRISPKTSEVLHKSSEHFHKLEINS